MSLNYFKNVRQDLYVLLDDGCNVGDAPGNGAVSVFGSLVLDADKFPDFTGEPWERLTKLRCKLMELGYRGLGLWICANATGEEEAHPLSGEEAEIMGRACDLVQKSRSGLLESRLGISLW